MHSQLISLFLFQIASCVAQAGLELLVLLSSEMCPCTPEPQPLPGWILPLTYNQLHNPAVSIFSNFHLC